MVKALAAVAAAIWLFAGCAAPRTGCAIDPVPAAPARGGDSAAARAIEPEETVEEHALAQEVGARGGSGGSMRGEVRLSRGAFSTRETRGDETYAKLVHTRLRLSFRRKAVAEGALSSFNVAFEPVPRMVALHGGGFCPDLGGGLVAGGLSVRSLSSGGFPFAERRWFAANTGSYGRAVFGGAVEVVLGRFRAAAFGGKERFARTDGMRLFRRPASGGRVEARWGSFRIGMTAANDPREAGGPRTAIDARVDRKDVRAGMQVAFARKAPPGAMMALSLRQKGFRASCLSHVVPPGLAGSFGRINARDIRASVSYGGAAVVMERVLPRRARIRVSAECTERCEDSERSTGRLLRFEFERGWRSFHFTASWGSTFERRIPLVPLPTDAQAEEEGAASFGALAAVRIARGASIRITAKNVAASSGAEGVLFSAILRADSPASRMRVIAGCTAYRTRNGRVACYYHEPTLSGAYPWHYAACNINRAFVISIININMLRLSYKAECESRRRAVGILEASASF